MSRPRLARLLRFVLTGAACVSGAASAETPPPPPDVSALTNYMVGQRINRACAELRFSGADPNAAVVERSSGSATLDQLLLRFAVDALVARRLQVPDTAVKQADGTYLDQVDFDVSKMVWAGREMGCAERVEH